MFMHYFNTVSFNRDEATSHRYQVFDGTDMKSKDEEEEERQKGREIKASGYKIEFARQNRAFRSHDDSGSS